MAAPPAAAADPATPPGPEADDAAIWGEVKRQPDRTSGNGDCAIHSTVPADSVEFGACGWKASDEVVRAIRKEVGALMMEKEMSLKRFYHQTGEFLEYAKGYATADPGKLPPQYWAEDVVLLCLAQVLEQRILKVEPWNTRGGCLFSLYHDMRREENIDRARAIEEARGARTKLVYFDGHSHYQRCVEKPHPTPCPPPSLSLTQLPPMTPAFASCPFPFCGSGSDVDMGDTYEQEYDEELTMDDDDPPASSWEWRTFQGSWGMVDVYDDATVGELDIVHGGTYALRSGMFSSEKLCFALALLRYPHKRVMVGYACSYHATEPDVLGIRAPDMWDLEEHDVEEVYMEPSMLVSSKGTWCDMVHAPPALNTIDVLDALRSPQLRFTTLWRYQLVAPLRNIWESGRTYAQTRTPLLDDQQVPHLRELRDRAPCLFCGASDAPRARWQMAQLHPIYGCPACCAAMAPVLRLAVQMREWHMYYENSHEDVAEILVTLYSIYPMVAPCEDAASTFAPERPGWDLLEPLLLQPLDQ